MCRKSRIVRHGIRVLCLTAVFICTGTGGATAQLPSIFELEGDALTGAHSGLPDDWDRLNVTGGSAAMYATGVLGDPRDSTIFTGGSEDILDIPDWRWCGGSVADKDDITNAYAGLYPSGKFFSGADRYGTNGTAYMGFWLLQGDFGLNPDGTFYGQHTVGDILVLCDFLAGGGPVTARVFRWVGPGGEETSLEELTVSPATTYAVVNSADAPSPWPYEPNFGTTNVFPIGAFLEAGVDLEALCVGNSFAHFLAETRFSPSVSAELKDFVFGTLNTVSVGVVGRGSWGRIKSVFR